VERWWPRNPWRGLSVRERRRLARLSTSGKRINDPEDAEMVHAYVEYLEWFNGTVGHRFINSVGPFVVVPTLTVGLVLWALHGDAWHSVLDAALLMAYLLSFRLNRSRRQRLRRTAAVNAWNDLG
jgi:hypothetical protein